MMFREIGQNIWTVDSDFSTFGIQFGGRMTVVGLTSGGVAVISPIDWQEAYRSEFDKRGGVKAIIAPNKFHHMFVRPLKNQYPDAQVFATPGLAKKLADVEHTAFNGNQTPDLLKGALEIYHVEGCPAMDEYIFHHPQSKTVILIDYFLNMRANYNLPTRITMKLAGIKKHVCHDTIIRMIVKDKAKFLKAGEQILAWNPNQVVLCHGDIIRDDSLGEIEEAIAWMVAS